MRFEELYHSWHKGRLTQEQAANVLGISSRTFRLVVCIYKRHKNP